jgi:hypothetical protein
MKFRKAKTSSEEQKPREGIEKDTRSLKFDKAERNAGLKLGDTLHIKCLDIQPTSLDLRRIRSHHLFMH